MTDNSGAAGSDGLTVTCTPIDGVRVITVRGEIDHDSGGSLRQALILPGGTALPRIVVDLGGVTFMDSSGINILIAAHNAARGAGGWLRLAGPTDSVLRTMRLVGLDEVIDCHATVRDALDA
ncbi:STAS domain-containing protein [Streptomyces sp. NPDC000345]|uniref:STAS domain-containing protein n=1 Tax=Streptomyces sp. NPDC000345 TaxID=3364537 RepID=UPI0036B3A0D3